MADPTAAPLLFLAALESGQPNLTPAMSRMLAEAASVCLADQDHPNSVELPLRGDEEDAFGLVRLSVGGATRRSYNDLQEAVEWGAVAIALLVTRHLSGYTVVERSRKGTGFDYWLGDEEELPFQKKACLEVSGILNGPERIASRIAEKLRQVERGRGRVSGFVVVVEFSTPQVRLMQT
ncbi:MAG TPA: hypothetical protein VGB13_02080 [Candidatus Krumholzibacteria bacterium]